MATLSFSGQFSDITESEANKKEFSKYDATFISFNGKLLGEMPVVVYIDQALLRGELKVKSLYGQPESFKWVTLFWCKSSKVVLISML